MPVTQTRAASCVAYLEEQPQRFLKLVQSLHRRIFKSFIIIIILEIESNYIIRMLRCLKTCHMIYKNLKDGKLTKGTDSGLRVPRSIFAALDEAPPIIKGTKAAPEFF